MNIFFKAGLTILLIFNSYLSAQIPTLNWAKQITETPSGLFGQEGYDIAVDASGNVYTIGYFYQASADFDPGPGVFTMTPTGGQDAYVSKLDANGNFIWARKLGGTAHETGDNIAVDAAGNVYAAGTFQGTGDFNPGAGTFNLTSAGDLDIFVTKLDASGNFVWAKSYGNTGYDFIAEITLDASDNLVLTGGFNTTVDFDPGAGIFNLTSTGTDVFITKLTSAGSFIWAKKFGGNSEDWCYDLALDNMGNILLTGYFYGTCDFDPGVAAYNLTSAGDREIFVNKLNSTGDFIWAKKVGSTSGDISYNVDCDNTGNVYFTGAFTGVVDFDPGAATFNLTSFGSGDVFVCKLNGLGNFSWVKQMGGTDGEAGQRIDVDELGNVYTAGVYADAGDYDPGPGTQQLNFSGGVYDIFITKLTTTGDYRWAIKFGADGFDVIGSIITDSNGSHIYTTGKFASTVDFNPGPGTNNLSSAANDNDAFILKLNQCSNGSTITTTSCGSFTLNAQTYATSGTYTQMLTNHLGCDSILVLNLIIKQNSSHTITASACNNYTLNGQTYTSSGTYTQNLTNNAGCDSIITLNLTINNSSANTINATACNSYTLNAITYNTSGTYTQTLTNHAGCDSILTLNLTINNSSTHTINATACNNYTLNATTYTSSGTYIQTLPNAQGCDSTITLHLTINQGSSSTINATACNSYTLNATTYNSSGTYTQTLTNHVGCDSIITLHLTINNNSANTINATACNNYTLNATTYTSSGTYTQTLTNAQGCDSILTLNLTINNSSTHTINATACNNYTLNATTYTFSGTYIQTLTNAQGCDSTITLHLTINQGSSSTINATACNSYTLNATNYTSSGTYIQTLTNTQGCDSTITLHLTINHSSSSTMNATACNSYTLNATTYNSSGTYIQTLTNAQGCDSTITLHLTINHGSSSTMNAIACNSYTLNATTYNSSGTYIQTLTNAQGCDSTITLHLIIHQNSAHTINATACNSYTLNTTTYNSSGTYIQTLTNAQGCDSTITLHLTINQGSSFTINATACNSYTLNAQTYNSSGTYTQTLSNASGCDSVITLILTVGSVDNSVTQNGIDIHANAVGSTYQWIDCDNGNAIITGETNQTFTATANGSYAVIITQNSCIDTSVCVSINNVSLDEGNKKNTFIIFPNPTTGTTTLVFEKELESALIQIRNITGQLISIKPEFSGNSVIVDLTPYAPGIYYIQVIEKENITHVVKLIKK